MPASRPFPLGRIYNTVIYWSFTTLSTVGYGDITPCNNMEMTYTVASMVCGSAMFAYIVGNISSVVTSRKGQELRMQEKMRELHEYLELRKIPKTMRDRVRRQCLHRWKKTVFDEHYVLQDLAPSMRRAVIDTVYGDGIRVVPAFRDLFEEDQEFVIELTIGLQPCSYQVEELITIKDDAGGDFYLITKGYVELVSSDGRICALLQAGDWFNELELFSDAYNEEVLPYTYTARSATPVEAYLLTRETFAEVYDNHPNVKQQLELHVLALLEDDRYKGRVRLPETQAEVDSGVQLIRVSENDVPSAGYAAPANTPAAAAERQGGYFNRSSANNSRRGSVNLSGSKASTASLHEAQGLGAPHPSRAGSPKVEGATPPSQALDSVLQQLLVTMQQQDAALENTFTALNLPFATPRICPSPSPGVFTRTGSLGRVLAPPPEEFQDQQKQVENMLPELPIRRASISKS